jgi:hypothetical protein
MKKQSNGRQSGQVRRLRSSLPGPLFGAIFVFGLLIIWGCAAGTPVGDQASPTPATVEDEPVTGQAISEEPTADDRSDEAEETEATPTVDEPPGTTAAADQTGETGSVAAETDQAAAAGSAVEDSALDRSEERDDVANVIAVGATGDPGAYRFSVEIASPDLGCEQYADWWEVLSEDGDLLYRRILAHSHVTEQPFVRSGGPVPIDPEQVVWIRAHMNPGGYGGTVFQGSIQSGFKEVELSQQFSAAAELPPLPTSCAF